MHRLYEPEVGALSDVARIGRNQVDIDEVVLSPYIFKKDDMNLDIAVRPDILGLVKYWTWYKQQ